MSEAEAPKKSWSERLFGGFRKTSERLGENLTQVVSTAKLDDATLDGASLAGPEALESLSIYRQLYRLCCFYAFPL